MLDHLPLPHVTAMQVTSRLIAHSLFDDVHSSQRCELHQRSSAAEQSDNQV